VPLSLGHSNASQGKRPCIRPLAIHLCGGSHLKDIGRAIERLVRLRNQADYDLSTQTDFLSDKHIEKTIERAETALALLDAINADPARQTAAIAAIRKAFPAPSDKPGK
jgi:hypothetical protein